MLLSRPISYVPELFPHKSFEPPPVSKPIIGGVGASIFTSDILAKAGILSLRFEHVRDHQSDYSKFAQQSLQETKAKEISKRINLNADREKNMLDYFSGLAREKQELKQKTMLESFNKSLVEQGMNSGLSEEEANKLVQFEMQSTANKRAMDFAKSQPSFASPMSVDYMDQLLEKAFDKSPLPQLPSSPLSLEPNPMTQLGTPTNRPYVGGQTADPLDVQFTSALAPPPSARRHSVDGGGVSLLRAFQKAKTAQQIAPTTSAGFEQRHEATSMKPLTYSAVAGAGKADVVGGGVYDSMGVDAMRKAVRDIRNQDKEGFNAKAKDIIGDKKIEKLNKSTLQTLLGRVGSMISPSRK